MDLNSHFPLTHFRAEFFSNERDTTLSRGYEMVDILINISVGLLIAAVVLMGINKLTGGKVKAAFVDVRQKMSSSRK